MVSTWIFTVPGTIFKCFQMFYGKWQQLGNSKGLLQLEIPLDHVTNFGSVVNGTVWITNPLIWIRILWISNLMNPLSKRIHQIKNSFLNLPKGTRNPFEDLNSVFGFTERNTPLGCVSDARTAPAGKTSLKK